MVTMTPASLLKESLSVLTIARVTLEQELLIGYLIPGDIMLSNLLCCVMYAFG
jgi:hypothetical protein